MIELMKNLFIYLVRSHVFLSISSFVFLFGLHGENRQAFLYSVMIGLGIIGIYNGHRLWKMRKGRLPHYLAEWTFYNRKGLVVLCACSLSVSIFIYLAHFSEYILQNTLALMCCLIAIFYVKRVKNLSLREIPYMKVWFVIAIWYCLFFLFPFLYFKADIPWITSLLFLIAILIPSDIKDIYDDKKTLRTLPQVFGIELSVRLMQLILCLALCIVILPVEDIKSPEPWSFGLCYLLLLSLFHKRIGYKYFFVVADSSFLLIGIMALFWMA